MTITEHLTQKRPSDGDISTFASSIQGTLPDDYRHFLKAENGGRPDPNQFRFSRKDGITQDGSIHYFFALYDGRVGSLKRNFDAYRGRVPGGYLPIGVDPFGNLILLRVTAQNPGKLFFWDHEEEDECIPSIKNMYVVANSFSGFLENLST